MELNLESSIGEAVNTIQSRKNEIVRLEGIKEQRTAQLEELDRLFYDAMFLYDPEKNEIYLGERNLGNSYRLMKKTIYYGDGTSSEQVFLTPNVDYLLDEDVTVNVSILKYDLMVSTKNPLPRMMLSIGESGFNSLDIAYVHTNDYPKWFTIMSQEIQGMITNAQVEVETQIGIVQEKINELRKLDVQM